MRFELDDRQRYHNQTNPLLSLTHSHDGRKEPGGTHVGETIIYEHAMLRESNPRFGHKYPEDRRLGFSNQPLTAGFSPLTPREAGGTIQAQELY